MRSLFLGQRRASFFCHLGVGEAPTLSFCSEAVSGDDHVMRVLAGGTIEAGEVAGCDDRVIEARSGSV
jgi:hypothetical protein